ncbi:MAG: phosphoglycerate mutase family protein [Bacteroidia bacterium]
MKSNAYLLITTLIIVCCSSCSTTIYLVRHAEKVDNSTNSPLSATGLQHANVLRDTLMNKSIDTIFASTFLRTQQTAQPLSTAINKSMVIYNKDTSIQFVNSIRNLRGKDILVVGHSDNIPQMVITLTDSIVEIPDSVFNTMFIVKIKRFPSKRITLIKTTY